MTFLLILTGYAVLMIRLGALAAMAAAVATTLASDQLTAGRGWLGLPRLLLGIAAGRGEDGNHAEDAEVDRTRGKIISMSFRVFCPLPRLPRDAFIGGLK